jgi:hypothetical protein
VVQESGGGTERMVVTYAFLASVYVYVVNGNAVEKIGVSYIFLAQGSRSEARAEATRKGLEGCAAATARM